MQDAAPTLLREDELALISALQLRPRASWTELGRALGVDPVTVARRFGRLSEQRAAWVGFSPGPRLFEQICVAFVVIDCAPGATAQVALALGAHPHMLTIERAAAGHDILATVATRDLLALSRYTLDLLPHLPGITTVQARIVTHMFTEGGRWRIAALAPGQRAQLTERPPAQTPVAPGEITPLDRALVTRLAHDGRAPYQSLANDLNVSLNTAKRRVEHLTRRGLLRFRCDFARPLGGWPVAVTLWAKVPQASTSSTAPSPCARTNSSGTSWTPTGAPSASSRPTSGRSRRFDGADHAADQRKRMLEYPGGPFEMLPCLFTFRLCIVMRIHKVIPLLTVVVFVLLHVFAYPGTRFSNDSYRYARSAYEFLGDPYQKAQGKALRAYCADTAAMLQRNRMLHQIEFRAPVRRYEFPDCLAQHADGLNPSNPRYEALFHARPAYPLAAAPFVRLLGAKAGLTAVALGFTALGGLLVLVLLRALRAPPLLAWLGQCLYYVTPIGLWGSRPMTEGPMIALMAAMLLGAVWLCHGRRAAGALLSVGAFALGFAVKYSSFALVAPCLVAASAMALIFVPQARHKGTHCLLIVSLLESLAAFAMSRVLRLPGLKDSLQDTFSLHWTYSEVADPWRRLVRLDVNYWWQWLQGEALAPSLLFLLALGAWGAISRSVPIALCLIAVGGTGLLTAAAHPVAMEGDRLYVQVWLIVVVGLPLLVERLRMSGGASGALPARSDPLMKSGGRQ